jgi:HSP20 family protein
MRNINRRANNLFGLMDDFFENNVKGLFNTTFKLDVQEAEGKYIVEADMPGIKKEEIDLMLKDGELSISVKKEEVTNEEQKNYIHKERRLNIMSRKIYLPNTKPESVKAKLEDGVLTIVIGKEEKTKHKINID